MKQIEKGYTAVLLLLMLTSVVAWGQAVSSLSGTVSDPSGAVIPGATIIIEDVERGLKRETTADPGGRYTFPQLQPGLYKVTGKASGFSDVLVNEVRLAVNTPTTINLNFEKIGQVAEVVSVSAESIQVNTTDASIGNAIGTKSILQMPLNARNIVGLLALQPGVVYANDSTDYRNGAVNGGKSDQANVTLDGVDVNDQMDRQAFTSVLRVTPDSVQEFRVTTLNANADAGRTSGAQVVLVTKSGTNELHGSLYEFHRNTNTSANEWFLNATGNQRRKLIRNIFGASAGGPVIKNRLFLFGNYEGRRDAKDGEGIRDVPSMNMRQGILQYKRRDGTIATVQPEQLRQIDPRGVSPEALKILQMYPQPNDTTRGDNLNLVGYRFKAPTPFKYNTYISKLDYVLDPASKHTVFVRGNLQNDKDQALPQFPGMAPNNVQLVNNKGIAIGLTSVFSPGLVSNFRWGLTRQGTENTGIINAPWVTLRGLTDIYGTTRKFAAIIPTHTIAEDMTWTRRAHTIQFGTTLRFIRNKRTDYQNSFSNASANASWLVSSGAELNTPFADLPASAYTLWRYAVTDVLGLVTQGNARYNYKVDGTVLGQGDAVLRNFAAEEYEFYAQDTWKLSRALTVTAGLRWSLMPPIHEKNGQQVSPNVRIGDWFDLRGSLAQQGKSQLDAGRISFIPVNSPGGQPLYDFHKKNFAPRIAIAYSPQGADGLSKFLFGGPGRTSIRAGWGMFYDLFGSGLMRSYDATSFGLSTSLTNPSAVLTAATAPKYSGFNSIPSGVLEPAPAAKFPAVYPDIFAITNGLDNTIRPPYNMNMNFSIGREFKNRWFVEASYVGRMSRRSLIRRDAAMPTDLKDPKSGMTYFEAASILARQVNVGVPVANVQKVPYWENLYSNAATATQTATQVVYSRYAANQYDWTYALYQLDTGAGQGNCVARGRCSNLGPYAFYHPQFSYLSVFSSIGGGNYHGAQLSLKKQFTSGDNLQVNYSFSKGIDLRSWVERASSSTGVLWNPWQPGLQKGVSDYDNTHLFNALGTYSLPFGRKRRWASDVHPVLNAIIGGWEISGIWRMSSGFATSVYATGVWPTNWNNNVWADWTGKPVATKLTVGANGPNMFPDPGAAHDAFDYPLPGGIGMRNGLRGNGVFNIDSNLAKRFVMPFNEKHSLQFRWETFNLTNTPRFDVYDVSLDISVENTFGRYTSTMSNSRVMQFGLRYEF